MNEPNNELKDVVIGDATYHDKQCDKIEKSCKKIKRNISRFMLISKTFDELISQHK